MPVLTPWLETLEPLAEPISLRRQKFEEDLPSPAAVEADLEAKRLEAQNILDAARTEAAELLEDAQVQAEALREAAWQEGHHQGKIEAQTAVETELRADWETRKEALRAEFGSLIGEIAAARETLWASQESEMVALTFDIAQQVIKTEVTQNPDVVRAVIANAVRRITDKENVRIRVSVSDAPHVKEMRQEILEFMDGLRHLEIVDDRRVGDGGCVIETNAGTIDAKIETQIAEVARALGVTENE